ncbi:hypothetical protein QQ045_026708 [Rhodiola kirilowii]
MKTGKRSNPSSPARSGPSSPTGQTSSKDPDRLLPIANVSRLMKKSLPANAKISKEAKETVQECVSEFISFITGEASDKCQREKRKTINGDDLLWAMTTLGFEDYIAPLKNYLSKFRELEGDKTSMVKEKQEAANDDHYHYHQQQHHQQQLQQLGMMNGHMGVGNFDKVVNFGGNGKMGFHDEHMGIENFDKVVNFGVNSNNMRLLQNFNGGVVFKQATDHHEQQQQQQQLGSSNGLGNGVVTANGAKLHNEIQW